MKHHGTELNKNTHEIDSESSKYNYTLSSYDVKLVKKVELQNVWALIWLEIPCIYHWNYFTLNFVCDTNRIHRRSAMWVLHH